MRTWNELTDIKELELIELASRTKPQLFLKHSVTCGISAHALEKLNEGADSLKETFDLHYLDLFAYRSISNEIATRYKITHQSPQVLIMVDKKIVYHSSHHAIQVTKILSAIL